MQRHAIISGGGTGVGADIARRFSAAGDKVTVLGRRLDPLNEIADETGAYPHTCDVTDRASVDEAIKNAVNKNGPVTIAIANAGIANSVPFAKMTPEDLHNTLQVNVHGVLNLWQASLPFMKDANWGRMIAIASIAGLKGFSYTSGYCASKHAVVGMTRALSIELAKTGITVNAVCPGFIETPMLEKTITNIVEKTGMSADDAAAAVRKGNPQDRFIQPEEVADTAYWLSTDMAKSVNGHALALSGGEI